MPADGQDPLGDAYSDGFGAVRARLRDRLPRRARYFLNFRVRPVLAVAAGLVVGGAIGVGLGAAANSEELAAILAPLLGTTGAVISAATALRRARADWDLECGGVRLANSRTIRKLLRRIRAQCRQLRASARWAGAPYRRIRHLADDLEEQAAWLARRVIRLRRVATQVRRNARKIHGRLAKTLGPTGSPQVREEFSATREAQQRLAHQIADNEAQQAVCLARMERIAALLDTARLELLRPVDSAAEMGTYRNRSIMEAVETELRATRDAVREVEQTEPKAVRDAVREVERNDA